MKKLKELLIGTSWLWLILTGIIAYGLITTYINITIDMIMTAIYILIPVSFIAIIILERRK